MFFLRLLLFLFFLITQAKSDVIYNLIGIQNLEILNSNNKNNIVYLNAKAPFQVGIRENNVTCFKSQNETIKDKFKVIEKSFNRYESTFLKKINLKYIILCEDLSVSGIGAGGVPNFKKKTIIINTKVKLDLLERIIHHETFHIINESYKNFFSEKNWKNLNYSGFNYAECSTCSDRISLSINTETKGFLSEYSKSTASEDMAEVFSFLMTNNDLITKNSQKDIVLKKKISFIKEGILNVDSSFNF